MNDRVRERRLLRLQDSLTARHEGGVAAALLLPYAVGAQRYALPYAQVARVTLPAGLAGLAGYSQLPRCVVGVAASDSEMLTVLDAGLLHGATPTQQTLKSRLIVMSDGAMKGFALLVSRVYDMAPLDLVREDGETQITDAQTLALALAARSRTEE